MMNRYWIEIIGPIGFELRILHHTSTAGRNPRYLDAYELGPRATFALKAENHGTADWPPAIHSRIKAITERAPQ